MLTAVGLLSQWTARQRLDIWDHIVGWVQDWHFLSLIFKTKVETWFCLITKSNARLETSESLLWEWFQDNTESKMPTNLWSMFKDYVNIFGETCSFCLHMGEWAYIGKTWLRNSWTLPYLDDQSPNPLSPGKY